MYTQNLEKKNCLTKNVFIYVQVQNEIKTFIVDTHVALYSKIYKSVRKASTSIIILLYYVSIITIKYINIIMFYRVGHLHQRI